MKKRRFPKVVSLFSCAMGMDLGFEKAGYEIVYTMDIDKAACNTIRRNRPWIVCDNADIANIRGSEILKKINLKTGDIDVIIGGTPCQPFSTAGRRMGINDERGIETGIHYKPVHEMTMYKTNAKLPTTEEIGQQIVTLPTHPNLTEENLTTIIEAVNKLC